MSVVIPHGPGNPKPNEDLIAPPDDFYPPLSVAEWKLRMRVDDNVSPARSAEILNCATLDITDERHHHEIYLGDARKVAPEKLRTVVRHPIKAV